MFYRKAYECKQVIGFIKEMTQVFQIHGKRILKRLIQIEILRYNWKSVIFNVDKKL